MTLNIPSPYSFILEAPISEAANKLAQLHRFAQEADFPNLTELIHLSKDECSVQSDDDPLELIKLYSKGLAYDKGTVYAVTPDDIWAFGAKLPNDRIAIFGLAAYPEQVETDDGCRQTPWVNVAHWSGSVCVCATDQFGRPTDQLDTESVRLVVSILMQAQHLGILKRPFLDVTGGRSQDTVMACL